MTDGWPARPIFIDLTGDTGYRYGTLFGRNCLCLKNLLNLLANYSCAGKREIKKRLRG